jgi:hypothetical protein
MSSNVKAEDVATIKPITKKYITSTGIDIYEIMSYSEVKRFCAELYSYKHTFYSIDYIANADG